MSLWGYKLKILKVNKFCHSSRELDANFPEFRIVLKLNSPEPLPVRKLISSFFFSPKVLLNIFNKLKLSIASSINNLVFTDIPCLTFTKQNEVGEQ